MSNLRDSRAQSINLLTPNIDISQVLTLYGVEYELDWTDSVVPDGQSIYVRWQMNPDKYTILTTRSLQVDQERAFYNAYTSFTGGSAIEELDIYKVRFDSDLESSATIESYNTPTTIDQSSRIIQVPLFGQAGQGNVAATGDLADEKAFRVYPPGLDVLLELSNESADPCYFKGLFKWFEISPRAMPPIRDF